MTNGVVKLMAKSSRRYRTAGCIRYEKEPWTMSHNTETPTQVASEAYLWLETTGRGAGRPKMRDSSEQDAAFVTERGLQRRGPTLGLQNGIFSSS